MIGNKYKLKNSKKITEFTLNYNFDTLFVTQYGYTNMVCSLTIITKPIVWIKLKKTIKLLTFYQQGT